MQKLDVDADTKFVARGIAHVDVGDVETPVSVAFVLMPRFTLLAFTSVIEPLRVANQLVGKALFEWSVFSTDGAPVSSSCGLPVVPDGPFHDQAPALCLRSGRGLHASGACLCGRSAAHCQPRQRT